MKKTITNLFLGLGMLLMTVILPGQSSAQSSSSDNHNGVKVYVQNVVTGGSAKTSRIDFLNTNHDNIVFTWSIKDKSGKIMYTSGFVELKAGSTFSYPNSNSDSVDMLNKEIKADEISISLKQ
ncbi:MAG TPA: hypothetical protein VNZ45_18445 [Bacteroidia bacterium]|jgi:hypothetical protein|nr:hypothetical protein [Bacteroidia bacterium]